MERNGQFAAAASVAGASRRLALWRERSGGPGRRLPERLWEAAVGLAREQGAGRIARLLRLNVSTLRRRLEPRGDGGGGSGRVARPLFVEIGAGASEDAGPCVVELAGRKGTKLTIRIRDVGRLDVAALSDSFWAHCL